MARILTIGKATQDVFMRSDEFDPHKEGKLLYTQLPLGTKMEVEDVIYATGGNAGNVAVTCARQGLDVEYMWTLGNDLISEGVLQDLDREGVFTVNVTQKDIYQAGYSVILIATNGERTILNHRGKSTGATGKDLRWESIDEADWVYPSSLATGGLALLEKIIDRAEAHDTKVILNPAGTELGEPSKLKALLENVDVLITNKEEMQKIVHGESYEELISHALNYVPTAIITDGPNGVIACDGKTLVRAGMYEDAPVIDRTGAGDAFGAGFLSQWAVGKSLKDSIVFASANATSVVRYIGAKTGILHKNASLHAMPIDERPYKKP